MCRLYAMRASEPTRVECSLVRAQNALMRQSEKDAEGLVHGHGWGVADYRDGLPLIERQTWAAFHGEHFRKAAARVYAHTVIAHVRRATVGGTSIENTHPFAQGRWIFAHNGTVPAFLKVRDRMMPHLDPTFAADIHGTTDSEHVFQFLMSLRLRHPEMTLREVVARGVNAVRGWAREAAPDKRLGLNIVMTDGRSLVGTRLGRTLWQLRRTEITPCPICGRSHVHHAAGMTYRAVEVASEPITDDAWQEVPDGSVFSVEEDYALVCEPLDSHGGLPPAPSRAPVSRI